MCISTHVKHKAKANAVPLAEKKKQNLSWKSFRCQPAENKNMERLLKYFSLFLIGNPPSSSSSLFSYLAGFLEDLQVKQQFGCLEILNFSTIPGAWYLRHPESKRQCQRSLPRTKQVSNIHVPAGGYSIIFHNIIAFCLHWTILWYYQCRNP